MAKIGFFKRIIREDFPAEYQDLVDKLAYPINSALESLASALNKNLTIDDNFNQQTKEFIVIVSSAGTPTPALSFKSELKTSAKGMSIIRVENLTSPGTYPPALPLISFTDSSGQILIDNIAGLTSGSKYRIRVVLLG